MARPSASLDGIRAIRFRHFAGGSPSLLIARKGGLAGDPSASNRRLRLLYRHLAAGTLVRGGASHGSRCGVNSQGLCSEVV